VETAITATLTLRQAAYGATILKLRKASIW